MTDVILRKAEMSDIKQLVSMRIAYLYEDLGEEAVCTVHNFEQELTAFFHTHLNEDIDAFVAEYKGEIISTSFTAYYSRLPHPDFPKGTAGVPINGYTKPEFRKMGLAGSLLKMSAEYAKQKGIELLNMEVTKKGLPVSKEIGFREINYTPVQMILKE
nr:GNAT family N-acetyltransferase [uncultured Clostridium sp.]